MTDAVPLGGRGVWPQLLDVFFWSFQTDSARLHPHLSAGFGGSCKTNVVFRAVEVTGLNRWPTRLRGSVITFSQDELFTGVGQ